MFIYCSECEYWFQEKNNLSFGQCRAKAPIPTKASSDVFIGPYNERAIWMFTRINDGCGEGEVRRKERVEIPEVVKDQTIKIETKSQVNAFEKAVDKARKGLNK